MLQMATFFSARCGRERLTPACQSENNILDSQTTTGAPSLSPDDDAFFFFVQAIAAGLGGPAVAAVLAALCLNYKHFGGGLPDLLLMRAVRTGRRTVASGGDKHAASADGAGTAPGVASIKAKAEAEAEADEEGEGGAEISTVSFPGDTDSYGFRRWERRRELGGRGRGWLVHCR